MLPAFLAGDPQLVSWDIYCFGYPTSLSPDISGVWAADPDLNVLAGYFIAATGIQFRQYSRLALIAHSMGGLILQRALLDGDFIKRVGHVLLFGTPSRGLRKAFLGRLFKRQVRDMVWDGKFIRVLRGDWNGKFGQTIPFHFRAVAGISDEFVPVDSSVEPFPKDQRSYVDGNHLQMVKPKTADTATALLLRQDLAGDSAAMQPATAPLLSSYLATVEQLSPKQEALPDNELVRLVLALEMIGDQPKAINILEKVHARSTELTGVLAGRLKRRWLADPDGKPDEGQRALELYQEAYQKAKVAQDHPQALYNGINTAFLTLALRDNRYDARQLAQEVLVHCQKAPRDKWRLATEGEAYLYLGEPNAALASYAAALDEFPDSREVGSMRQQAVWVARLLEDTSMENRIEGLFERRGY
jgi:tetratricopeptide (TPR) repeat protein